LSYQLWTSKILSVWLFFLTGNHHKLNWGSKGWRWSSHSSISQPRRSMQDDCWSWQSQKKRYFVKRRKKQSTFFGCNYLSSSICYSFLLLFCDGIGGSFNIACFKVVELTHFVSPWVGHNDLTWAAEWPVCYWVDWLLKHRVDVFTTFASCLEFFQSK